MGTASPTVRTRARTSLVACVVGGVVALALTAPISGAEPAPSVPSEASVPPAPGPGATDSTPSSSTPAPPTSAAAATESTPPTTTAVAPSLPPEYQNDPRAGYMVDPGESDGLDIEIAQNSFDPLSITVRPELIAAARAELEQAKRTLESVQATVEARRQELAEHEARLAQLDKDVRASVASAAEAREELADHAARAYIVGDIDQKVALVKADNFSDVGIARRYAGALGTATERLMRRYERESSDLSREQSDLAVTLATSRSSLSEAVAQEELAVAAVFDASAQLAAFEAGAHAYIKGFVFPIAGRSDFIDSWGFPRSGGRWHQGADIFAAHGTPLVASENGVLKKVGTAGLGGLRLWLVGDSGNEYYYAHLAGFAPDAADGKRVRAGELVGYVGDTGNARGTPPHLHFEIHPGGVAAVNPYPLLRAAYDARPEVPSVTPAAVPPGLIAPVGG